MSSPPVKYQRNADFTGFSTAHPLDQQNGQDLDAEFDDVRTTVNHTIDRLSEVQRADGQLANTSVHKDALSASVLALFAAEAGTPRGIWATATVYALKDMVDVGGETYMAVVAHTAAAAFATDLAAGKWLKLAAANQVVALSTIAELQGAAAGEIPDNALVTVRGDVGGYPAEFYKLSSVGAGADDGGLNVVRPGGAGTTGPAYLRSWTYGVDPCKLGWVSNDDVLQAASNTAALQAAIDFVQSYSRPRILMQPAGIGYISGGVVIDHAKGAFHWTGAGRRKSWIKQNGGDQVINTTRGATGNAGDRLEHMTFEHFSLYSPDNLCKYGIYAESLPNSTIQHMSMLDFAQSCLAWFYPWSGTLRNNEFRGKNAAAVIGDDSLGSVNGFLSERNAYLGNSGGVIGLLCPAGAFNFTSLSDDFETNSEAGAYFAGNGVSGVNISSYFEAMSTAGFAFTHDSAGNALAGADVMAPVKIGVALNGLGSLAGTKSNILGNYKRLGTAYSCDGVNVHGCSVSNDGADGYLVFAASASGLTVRGNKAIYPSGTIRRFKAVGVHGRLGEVSGIEIGGNVGMDNDVESVADPSVSPSRARVSRVRTTLNSGVAVETAFAGYSTIDAGTGGAMTDLAVNYDGVPLWKLTGNIIKGFSIANIEHYPSLAGRLVEFTAWWWPAGRYATGLIFPGFAVGVDTLYSSSSSVDPAVFVDATTGAVSNGNALITTVPDTSKFKTGDFALIRGGAGSSRDLLARVLSKTASTLTLDANAGDDLAGAWISPAAPLFASVVKRLPASGSVSFRVQALGYTNIADFIMLSRPRLAPLTNGDMRNWSRSDGMWP